MRDIRVRPTLLQLNRQLPGEAATADEFETAIYVITGDFFCRIYWCDFFSASLKAESLL